MTSDVVSSLDCFLVCEMMMIIAVPSRGGGGAWGTDEKRRWPSPQGACLEEVLPKA